MSSVTTAPATVSTPAASPRYGLGFQTLEEEATIDQLAVEGALPSWLAGTLLRTGPGRFEAGERTLNHWFDGLAMLHRFSFADGEVSYANRYLRSRAWRAAEETGAIGYMEFATDPCRSFFSRVATMFSPGGALSDNGVVNVTRLGERFVALTEVPLPVAFDPKTLETAGVVDYDDSIGGVMTTAHPHQDPCTGDLVNYMTHFGALNSYRVYSQAAGSMRRREIVSIPVRRPSYMHSFAITERYVVLAEFPLVVNPISIPLSGRPFIENYRWKPALGTRFIVVDKATGKVRSRHQGSPCFAFHHINAFEDGDELVVDMCAYDDDEIIRSLYLEPLRSGAAAPEGRVRRYRIPPAAGADASEERIGDLHLELPRIDYRRCNGRPYRFVYGSGHAGSGFSDCVVKLDVQDGEALRWAEDGCYAGEPVYVPAPGASAEDEGVLLSVVLDADAGTSFLLVLDAATLEERARVRVPHHIPFGFHGMFSNTPI
jgi:carotenoid cleavage dioxygenase-like enzyme